MMGNTLSLPLGSKRAWEEVVLLRRAIEAFCGFAEGKSELGPEALSLLGESATSRIALDPAGAKETTGAWAAIFERSIASLAAYCDKVAAGTQRPTVEDVASLACGVRSMVGRLDRRLCSTGQLTAP